MIEIQNQKIHQKIVTHESWISSKKKEKKCGYLSHHKGTVNNFNMRALVFEESKASEKFNQYVNNRSPTKKRNNDSQSMSLLSQFQNKDRKQQEMNNRLKQINDMVNGIKTNLPPIEPEPPQQLPPEPVIEVRPFYPQQVEVEEIVAVQQEEIKQESHQQPVSNEI